MQPSKSLRISNNCTLLILFLHIIFGGKEVTISRKRLNKQKKKRGCPLTGMAVMARKSMAVYKGEREYSHGPYQPWPWDGSANGW